MPRASLGRREKQPSIATQLLPKFLCIFICVYLCIYLARTRTNLAPVKPEAMAWMSSGSSNAALIKNLASNGLITSERVKNAMLNVDRAHFCPQAPYTDSPQTIGYSATISAPHMHASAAESLLPYLSRPDARILDIGSGSGYLTAVLASLLGPQGRVIGIDHIQGLVDLANKNMAKSEQGKQWLENGKVKFVKGDGRLGYREDEVAFGTEGDQGYDAIHVGAAAKEAHETLVQQLRRPGRLFIPVGEDMQHIWIIDKKEDGTVVREKSFGVRYVPLTDAPKH